MTKKKSPINPSEIIKWFFVGIILLITIYIVFLIKINRLEFKWVDTGIGICHKNVYGINIDQKEIIKLPFPQDKSTCL